ncbi:MAG: ABC transporter ATP-binding protein [Candidatus Berkelbacteria bacterium]|nr:ABC transporter ATP-binding protein [Candidatus Berkelbacteria bacterium]
MKLIEFKKVVKTFKQGTKAINAVGGISFTIDKGDFVAIIGPSGSGKSTILQLLGGLDRPTEGEIEIEGKNIAKMSEGRLTRLRRNSIGFIFQNFNLIPTLTALQNVEAGMANRSTVAAKRARSLLHQLGLGERMNHLPSLLSGGEQQRVAIARSLVHEPKILLADEPTGNLDSRTGQEILRVMAHLNEKMGQTIIVVTHSDYISNYATRILHVRDGKILSDGALKIRNKDVLEKAV